MSDLSYTVYEPAKVEKNLVTRADKLVFVKDGFAFWAMIVPVFWMIYHRLWLPLIGFVVAIVILQLLAYLFGIPDESSGFLLLGLSLAFGFLANDIRRLVLERDEYRLVGAIAGSSQLECERRFFHNWTPLLDNLHKEENL